MSFINCTIVQYVLQKEIPPIFLMEEFDSIVGKYPADSSCDLSFFRMDYNKRSNVVRDGTTFYTTFFAGEIAVHSNPWFSDPSPRPDSKPSREAKDNDSIIVDIPPTLPWISNNTPLMEAIFESGEYSSTYLVFY